MMNEKKTPKNTRKEEAEPRKFSIEELDAVSGGGPGSHVNPGDHVGECPIGVGSDMPPQPDIP